MNLIWQQNADHMPLESSDLFYKIDRQDTDLKIYPDETESAVDYDAFRWPIDDREIIRTDRDYFNHFKLMKTNYLRLAEKVDMTRSVMERSYNQAKSVEALMRYVIIHYE